MSSGRSSSGWVLPDRNQVLPGQRNGVVRLEAAGESKVLDPIGLLRKAPELPRVLPQRERNARLGLELLDIRLAGAVGSGLVKANSAFTSKSDGATAGRLVRRLSRRLKPAGLKWSAVLMPPMRLADASKPSGGRLKALCSL